MTIISGSLFEKTLIDPIRQGADEIFVVSGYATATMATRHIEAARSLRVDLKVRLIVGMCPQDGIEKRNHTGLIELHEGREGVDFRCNYVIERPPVHSKIYTWFKNGAPFLGYVGSANYTQNAFSASMREILVQEDAEDCFAYFRDLQGETIECNSEHAPELINIYDRRAAERRQEEEAVAELDSATAEGILSLESVKLPLVDRYGNVPLRSGLNWGQRPELGREPNQAYLSVPADIGRSGFFPERYIHFTVTTDDGKNLICVRAQDNGKAIQTPLNNSLIGEYFRYRLGLANGAPVTFSDLINYGRTDVSFYKIDEENYYMDFAVR